MMKVVMQFLIFSLAFIAISFSAVRAEPYIGINLGTASIDNYEDANSGFIYAGYDQPYWAVEAGVNPLGYYRFEGFDSTIQIDGFEVDALGKLPINNRLAAYAKVGYFSYSLTPELFGVKQNKLDGNTVTYGVGLMMDFGQTLKARVAYEIYDDVESLEASRLVFGIAAKVF